MNRQVTLKPQHWDGFDGWEVLDDANFHLGLIGVYGDDGYKPYFRAYGVALSLDFHRVAAEKNFPTRDEAVEWIIDGFPGAES